VGCARCRVCLVRGGRGLVCLCLCGMLFLMRTGTRRFLFLCPEHSVRNKDTIGNGHIGATAGLLVLVVIFLRKPSTQSTA